jgi:hypothetical protein
VLADTLRHEHGHWRALSTPSPLLAEIKALTRDRDRLLETQQAVESQLRMILEAYHPAPARLFSSVDRQITLSFVHDHPTPAIASRVKTTRMGGFLTRHHYTGRVPAQVLAERMRANLPPARPAPSPARASPPRHVPGEVVCDRVHAAGARGVRGVGGDEEVNAARQYSLDRRDRQRQRSPVC